MLVGFFVALACALSESTGFRPDLSLHLPLHLFNKDSLDFRKGEKLFKLRIILGRRRGHEQL